MGGQSTNRKKKTMIGVCMEILQSYYETKNHLLLIMSWTLTLKTTHFMRSKKKRYILSIMEIHKVFYKV